MKLNIIPLGYNLLVRPTPPPADKGVIVRIEKTKDADERAATTGTILAIGNLAWADFPDNDKWAKVGDVVIFKAHTGMRVKNNEDDEKKEDGEKYLLLMRDVDIAAIQTGES